MSQGINNNLTKHFKATITAKLFAGVLNNIMKEVDSLQNEFQGDQVTTSDTIHLQLQPPKILRIDIEFDDELMKMLDILPFGREDAMLDEILHEECKVFLKRNLYATPWGKMTKNSLG